LETYFHEKEAIAAVCGGQTEYVLEAVANRYIGANPKEPPVYRVYSAKGFPRLEDCRYDMRLHERWPELTDGQLVYVWGMLWCSREGDSPFSLSCYGPAKVYVNGSLQFRSNLNDDVFPDRRVQFRSKLRKGWNHIVLEFTSTGTGCGGRFGTGSVKGAPMHFLAPTVERKGQEGWVYTAPLDNPWAEADFPGLDESGEAALAYEWYPKLQWDAQEKEEGCFARIFGTGKGRTAFAWSGIRCDSVSGGSFRLTGMHKGACKVFLDGERVHETLQENGALELTLKVGFGAHDLLISSVCGSGQDWDIQLGVEAVKGAVGLVPAYPVEGLPDSWLYLGPFLDNNAPDPAKVLRMDSVFGPQDAQVYWRADLPEASVRPYLETLLYGRWNYPLGVTLYGILKTGQELGQPQFLQYAADHIEQCSSLHDYAMWDCEQYGSPGINHQLALIDSLDDCGSFGAVMLAAHAIRPLAGVEQAAAHIARYITDIQDRLEDGALYRVKGTTDFMMGTQWCDDLYMSIPFLCKYYTLTGDMSYLDDAALQFRQYKKRLFIPETGIMHHVYDHKFNKPNGVPWGRGNGWVLFSLTELLEVMPDKHAMREEMLQFFRELCQGYLQLQGVNGLWHQVLTDPESYEESSCTSMFIYAFARGVRFGWLQEPDPYAEAAVTGWEALTKRCIDREGNVYGICRGSGYSFNKLYYKDQLTWQLNDTHGTGIILLAGMETLKLKRMFEAAGA
jgi:unsaturated rhamnogalacturonyl hydrolase